MSRRAIPVIHVCFPGRLLDVRVREGLRCGHLSGAHLISQARSSTAHDHNISAMLNPILVLDRAWAHWNAEVRASACEFRGRVFLGFDAFEAARLWNLR